MAYSGYSAYSRIANTIDSKEIMLVKLLEGTVRHIQFARRGLAAGDPKVKGENICTVVSVIAELENALDREAGGSLAENLSALYQYMLRRLTVANLKNDDAILQEVENLLATIRDGFKGALEQQQKHVVPAGTAAFSDASASSSLKRGFSIAV